jgi:predicted adenine nucleotide alpha hydrolase (AANH) superfamily ATPase
MRLLLHVCCGPCSLYPTQHFKNEKIYFEGYFYNPNIHPIEEFEKRKVNSTLAAKNSNFVLHISNHFNQEIWENYPYESLKRCEMCYHSRLSQTAIFASENGFDWFSTTLLVSPYQNHNLIKEIGEYYSRKYSVEFYYEDMRIGFREGQNLARSMELYRQKYCGCIKSIQK